jgi:hypothetical protein
MLRNLQLLLIILVILAALPCRGVRLYDRMASSDPESCRMQPGDYLTSLLGNNRLLVNSDFTYTTMVYSNISRDFDVIMTFGLFELGGSSRSSLKDQSEVLLEMFVNGSGLYLRSNKQLVYDLSAALRKSANFTTDFSAMVLTEDLSVQVYVGNSVRGLYYPVMQPLVQLGEQFVYGYCPRTSRLTLYGYSFQGRYDLSNSRHHFSMFMDFDEFTSTSSNTSSIAMKGSYKDAQFRMELLSLGSTTSAAVKFNGNGTYSAVDENGKEVWRSQRLPVCRELTGYNFLSLYLETYAPYVGLYNEAGQLLWKFGQLTDCSLTQQF